MLSKYLGGADGEWGIQKDRRCWHFTTLHQVNEIDDQFLGAFDGERWNKQSALGDGGITNLGR